MTDPNLLKDTRTKLGLTQQEFADRYWDEDQSSISRIERGKRGLTKIGRKYINLVRKYEL